MYLTKLEIENIKLLQFGSGEELRFTDENDEPRMWTAILGDNGLCKTTILQAIALCASGDKLTRSFVEDARDYVRRTEEEREASITATFAHEADLMRSRLVVPKGSHDFEGEDSWVNQVRSRRKPGYFVAGYGVGRRLARPGEVATSKDWVSDRLEGLFDAHHKMLGLEFASQIRGKRSWFAEEIMGLVKKTVGGKKLLPGVVDIRVAGRGDARVKVEVDYGSGTFDLAPAALSAGYQSTLTWLADFLGQAYTETKKPIKPKEMEGIVLLDEIDLHLHPTWQRRIVPILRDAFPRVQFIVTTHSPLVLTGFESDEIIELQMVEGLVVQKQTAYEPAMQDAAQLMATFFGVPMAGRDDLMEKQRRFLELLAKKRPTKKEKAERDKIRYALGPYHQASVVPGSSARQVS